MDIEGVKRLPSAMLGQWTQFPRAAAVYFIFCDGDLMYIGQSRNLYNRIQNHRRGWDRKTTRIYWLLTPTRNLLTVECENISLHRPKMNRVGVECRTPEFCCERCGYLWDRRSVFSVDLPKQCPYCKSPKWNIPKQKLKGERL